jgi:peptidoglycan hydrolase-like protein with peptidoglycan-binding domain
MIAHTSHPKRSAAARLNAAAAATLLTLVALLGIAAPAGAATGGGVSIASGTPSAKAANDTGTGERPRSVGKVQVRRAQTLLRLPATGKHDASTRKAVRRFQELRGLAPYGIIDLPTYLQIRDAFALLQTGGLSLGEATASDDGGATPTATTPEITLPDNLAEITPQERAILDRIAACESKGDPTAISASGQFRGKYQFDRTTWKTVGGTGDPAAATEAEQDQRAAILLRQRGTAPWPNCA